jgi:hypothetical protein
MRAPSHPRRHQAGGHLRATSVVDAQKQDARVEVRRVGLKPSERSQPILGQPLDKDRHPDLQPGIGENDLERLGHEALDRFDVHPAFPAAL